MFADLLIPEIQAQLAAIMGLLIEKGVFTTDEYQTALAQVKEILNDPQAMHEFRKEHAKRTTKDT